MKTLLYIKTSPKPDGLSRSSKIGDAFVNSYLKHHPEDRVEVVDLYKEDIDFLRMENMMVRQTGEADEASQRFLKYAQQFKDADKIVFSEPLWNLGLPAILKAYIDYVCVNKITFYYTDKGPVGMCEGKKALNIATRGGGYSTGPAAEKEMGDRYLNTICSFMGIHDYTTLGVDFLDVMGMDTEAILNQAIADAETLAVTF